MKFVLVATNVSNFFYAQVCGRQIVLSRAQSRGNNVFLTGGFKEFLVQMLKVGDAHKQPIGKSGDRPIVSR